MEAERREWAEFVGGLQACARLERPWTLELTDPLDASWLSAAEGELEGEGEGGRLSAVTYERTQEENEVFGVTVAAAAAGSDGGSAAPMA